MQTARPGRWASAALLLVAGCRGGAFTVYEENDRYSIRGNKDRYYTQGLRASLVSPPAETPALAQAVADHLRDDETDDDEVLKPAGIVLGQNIYTPSDITLETPQKRDRPYAGWLYTGAVFASQKRPLASRVGDDQRTLEIDVGVTGPPSLAEDVQTQWHKYIDVPPPQGWDHQIHTEPGIVATYERRNRVMACGAPYDATWDVLPGYAVAAGNIDTHAAASTTARIGWNLPRDFGVNTISTTAMETTDPKNGALPSLYFFGGSEIRYVARNIFLDGNTFRDSAHVDARPIVAEFRIGIAIQYKRLRVSYSWITRSEEFNGQAGWMRYGSLSFSWLIDF
jgi:lipid A 3-O-deacylase